LVTAASLILTKEKSSAASSSAGEEFDVSKGDAIHDYTEEFSKGCLSTLVSGVPSPLLQDKPLNAAIPVEVE